MATSGSAVKQRQLVSRHAMPPSTSPAKASRGKYQLCFYNQVQLHAQLAQLSANLADTENLLRMTSVQAESMRGLGSWHGGL